MSVRYDSLNDTICVSYIDVFRVVVELSIENHVLYKISQLKGSVFNGNLKYYLHINVIFVQI